MPGSGAIMPECTRSRPSKCCSVFVSRNGGDFSSISRAVEEAEMEDEGFSSAAVVVEFH